MADAAVAVAQQGAAQQAVAQQASNDDDGRFKQAEIAKNSVRKKIEKARQRLIDQGILPKNQTGARLPAVGYAGQEAAGAAGGSADAAAQAVQRIIVEGDDGDVELEKAAEKLAKIILIRDKYKNIDKGQDEPLETADAAIVTNADEVYNVHVGDDGIYRFDGMRTVIPTWAQYITDFKQVFDGLEVGPTLSACRTRLQMLEEKFELYSRMNAEHEKALGGGTGVFGTGPKVDNSVRMSTSMNARTLSECIVKQAHSLEAETVEVIRDRDGKTRLTLADTLRELGVDEPARITIEGLGLHPPLKKRFRRFDILDPELNKAGAVAADILNVFLQPRTLNNGRYFADVVRKTLEAHERSRYPLATELKFTVNGATQDEWSQIARWIRSENLYSYSSNMWIVQISRIGSNRGEFVECATNMDQLMYIFQPMFDATVNPTLAENVDVAQVLLRTGAISIISDEVVRRRNLNVNAKSPKQMPWAEEPDDNYFFYYVWANLAVLNALRRRRGLNTLQFRPTCGETTPHWDQLVSSYLLADSINQGPRLEKSWVLQYLYLFHKIGISMSPLSNNGLFIPYVENPFKDFFKRGLEVSLSTDDPLHYHHGSEPLIEEYATAKKIYKLSSIDMAEIARNSVFMSSFPHDTKVRWLGEKYPLGVEGNDARKSGVPDCRLQFRQECLLQEQTVLNLALAKKSIAPIVIHKIKVKGGRQQTASHTAGGGGGGSALVAYHNSGTSHTELALRRFAKYFYVDPRQRFPRIDIVGTIDQSSNPVHNLQAALRLRERYRATGIKSEDLFPGLTSPSFNSSEWEYNSYYGVTLVSRRGKPPFWPSFIPKVDQFITDIDKLRRAIVNDSAVKELAKHRLALLEHKFGLHLAMNIGRECGVIAEKELNNRDFFSAHKVDNNIHTDSGMNARLLFHFFMEKAMYHGDDVVVHDDGQSPITLTQLLESLNVNLSNFTVDELTNLLSTNVTLHDIFLTTSDYTGGRYFAELTKQTLTQYSLDQYTFAENRLIIQGTDLEEWTRLAEWFNCHGMASRQVRWIVELPRNYKRLRRDNKVKNFGEFLENIFSPLWEASLHWEKHAKLHYLLTHISGFDTVYPEQRVDPELVAIAPHDWRDDVNPPYNYYLYFFWSNLVSLNTFRHTRGMTQFKLRPQCGECGAIDHLLGGFLLADGINHGVSLAQCPGLEYLFYIAQIGIAMSPLSNTSNAVAYLDNPFPKFFRRGLNVSLATNKPLDFHFTQEPLIEEYSVAAKVWKLSYNDLSEVARSSVRQSGFSNEWKEQALGPLWHLHSVLGNQVQKSRVSDIRIAYRYETYHAEIDFLDAVGAAAAATSHHQKLDASASGKKPSLVPFGANQPHQQPHVAAEVPRAMLTLDEELSQYEATMGSIVLMPYADEEEDNNEEDTVANALATLKRQVEEMQSELSRVKLQVRMTEGDNSATALSVKKLREALAAVDGLRLDAKLGVSA